MAKDDMFLPVEMERLEIEPVKVNKGTVDENPFTFTLLKSYTRSSPQSLKCLCTKKGKTLAITKKKHAKLLKEPVLQLLQNCNRPKIGEDGKFQTKESQNQNADILSLCALVDNCNQLKISSDTNENTPKEDALKTNEVKWWATDQTATNTRREASERSQPGSSCSQQALNPPCDVTIDELASYFETLVHIPKKMSSMAEMMYI